MNINAELDAARTEAALAPIVAAIVFTALLDESVRIRKIANELKEEGLAEYEAGVDRRAAWNTLTEAVELGRQADRLREIVCRAANDVDAAWARLARLESEAERANA